MENPKITGINPSITFEGNERRGVVNAITHPIRDDSVIVTPRYLFMLWLRWHIALKKKLERHWIIQNIQNDSGVVCKSYKAQREKFIALKKNYRNSPD